VPSAAPGKVCRICPDFASITTSAWSVYLAFSTSTSAPSGVVATASGPAPTGVCSPAGVRRQPSGVTPQPSISGPGTNRGGAVWSARAPAAPATTHSGAAPMLCATPRRARIEMPTDGNA
jgi:hypothetical protein